MFAHEKKKPTQAEISSPEKVPETEEGANSSALLGLKSFNNIFVQGLPRGTDEDSLKNLFTAYG